MIQSPESTRQPDKSCKDLARSEEIQKGGDVESFGKILTFQNAKVTPYRRVARDRRKYLMGGFQFPESTSERFLDARWLPDPEPFANDDPPAKQGHFLYGGLFDPHFGHFMAECIHRLWAWRYRERDYDGVVFAAVPRFRTGHELPGFVRQTLAWFGIPAERSLFVHVPQRFGVLDVPELGRRLDRGSIRGYDDILAQVLTQPEPRGLGARLYLSRRLLPWTAGRILGERWIEQWLAAQGYEILYPERLILEEQVARYRGAAEIVVSGGSAINGLQLIPNLHARVALIQRRHGEANLLPWRERVSAGGFVRAIDWTDGFATNNEHASALDPKILTRSLSDFWGCPSTINFDPDQFRDQAFDDFTAWFKADAARALEADAYTEARALKILRGYFAHLKRQGGPTPKQRSELQHLVFVYGDGTTLD